MDDQLEKFIKEHCDKCKNKNSDVCEIRRSINNRLYCTHEETR